MHTFLPRSRRLRCRCVCLPRGLRAGLLSGLLLGTLALPSLARAQYKNMSFTLDAAGTFITRPDLVDANGAQLANAQLPLRLAYGERLGGEVNFKLNDDHWWFSGRINGAILHYGTFGDPDGSLVSQYDSNAQENVGTLFGLQGVAGVRYYFFTDRIRPFVQGAVSYMRLFTFTGQTGTLCSVQGICNDGGSYGDVFLPHQNVLAAHLEPGIEFILKRDLALTLALDYQRWLFFNASDNNAFNLSVGVTFYG